jgi:anti-sigma B factor antagonist
MRAVQTTAHDEWRAAIALRGELDIANADHLRAELLEHLAAGRRVIRVDVGAVEFMDSTALGELVSATDRCIAEQRSLILTNVPPRLRRLIELARLDQVLLIDTAGESAEPQLA